MNLDERFKSVPAIVSQSCTQTSTENTAADVTGSKVGVDVKPVAGLAYRIRMAGNSGGGNAAHTVLLILGSTTLMTLTQDAAAAADYVAQFDVLFKNAKAQRVMGKMDSDTQDCECDYAAGTVDCTSAKDLKVQIKSGHASDTVTCELVTVEKWQLDLT
jgi:hypothetical protein